MSRRWSALFACICAAFGYGLWEAGAGLLPEADPARWTLGESSVPIEVAQLAGDLRPRADALDLWSYRVASPRVAPFRDGIVELEAHVPTAGQLSVRLGADTVAGPERPMRPPLDGPMGGEGPMGGPPPPRPTGARPVNVVRGAGLLIDRGARNGIVGRQLTCDPAPAPTTDTFTLRMDARGGAIDVAIDGRTVTRCRGSWEAGAVVLSSGVRRVALSSVRVTPSGGAEFTDTFGGPLRSRFFGVLCALFGGALGLFIARRRPVGALPLLALPLLGLPLLARLDTRAALDALRLLAVPEALGPLLFTGVPAGLLLTLYAGSTAPSLRGSALRGAVPPALLLPMVLFMTARSGFPEDAPGWFVLAALMVPLAALAWINTHDFNRRVAASWALTLLVLCGTEGGLRLTALDRSWAVTAGWKRASEEFSELLEIRRYRSYPDEGFPVRPPDPDPTRRRIVALGGSSTGGAYQMDDIGQFWPQRLQERLGGQWQVVNQGVGGWNTLHVRLYLESQIERLDADIYTIYVGHNDILSPSPVPYRELYAGYQTPDSRVRAVSRALNTVRLYVGLKYAIFGLVGTRAAVAVPVEDARDNLAAIIAIAQAHDARVLLVTEGLNPDPAPMAAYGRMLADLATSTGSAYFDAARALSAEDPELFLDDCHLSVAGHRRLAEWIEGALRGAGWL